MMVLPRMWTTVPVTASDGAANRLMRKAPATAVTATTFLKRLPRISPLVDPSTPYRILATGEFGST